MEDNKGFLGKLVLIIAAVIIVAAAVGYFYYKPSLSGYATSAPSASIGTAQSSALGTILVDSNGMTLYTKSGDSGSSSCYDTCAANWPPLITSGAPTSNGALAGTLGTITRTDGKMQATYNNMPLYYYVKDTAAGQTNGQGVAGIWSVVVITPPSQTAPAPTPALTPTTTATTKTTPSHYDIIISNYAFSPSTLTIRQGDTVTWTNKDPTQHTIISDSGTELDSGSLAAATTGYYGSSPGGTYSHTFNTIGTFGYHCSIHTSMKGTIIVQ